MVKDSGCRHVRGEEKVCSDQLTGITKGYGQRRGSRGCGETHACLDPGLGAAAAAAAPVRRVHR